MQYDGLIAVSKYAVFGVPLDRAIQHEAFQLATDDRQFLGRKSVIHTLHFRRSDD